MTIIIFLFALLSLLLVKATKPAGYCKKVRLCKNKSVMISRQACKSVPVVVAGKRVITRACTNVNVPTAVQECNQYWSCLKTLNDKKPTLHLIKRVVDVPVVSDSD